MTKYNRTRTSLFATIFLGGLLAESGRHDAAAIVIRHDRDDAAYIKLAEKYPAAARVLPDGVCTLIAPDWCVTAAHVAEGLSALCRGVQVGGRTYEVRAVFMHPKWTGRPGPNSPDIALLRLARPVEGVQPAKIYDRDDELGKTIVFVGNGMTGDGNTGPIREDRKWRAATNVIEEIRGPYLRFRYDAPPKGTDLEGISGPGDSGGPALLERDGVTYIVGVSSSNDSGEDKRPCTYGTDEYYPRLSTSRSWLQQTMQSPPPDTAWGEVVRLQGDNWPGSPAARVAQAFLAAYAKGTDDAAATFEREYRAPSALRQRGIEERTKFWHQARGDWGELKPHSFVHHGAERFSVLLHQERGDEWKAFTFELESGRPHKLSGIRIGPASAPVN